MTHPTDRAPTATDWPSQSDAVAPRPSTPVRRTVLQGTRDVALTVMAVLVSIVCAFMIYVAVAAGSALADLGNLDPTPTLTENIQPVPTNSAGEECVGEVPPAGC